MSKNNVDKRLEPKSDGSEAQKLKNLRAEKDEFDLNFDALNDVMDTLRTIHLEEAPDVPFDTWFNSKDDDFFKRLKYAGGGKIIQFPVDLTKYREPKIKEINLSAGFSKDKTVASLTEDERKVVERLLRMSLGKDK
tara:strand:+ start:2207 stop:2614 length:408 start_codon:yes stop_codon:yes gene_type:complete